MASEGYHEREDLLCAETKDLHRGIVSLIEELEAIDWYQQRAEACADPELKAVLIHNRNEEIEHASMALEWIRRHSPELDRYLRRYLFQEGPIIAREHGDEASRHDSGASGESGSLRLGGLKGAQ